MLIPYCTINNRLYIFNYKFIYKKDFVLQGMVRAKIKPVRYWESAAGQRELFERMQQVLEVGDYRKRLKKCHPDVPYKPDASIFSKRTDSVIEDSRKRGYDVVIAYGDGADSAVVRFLGGGYNTLFAEICFGLGMRRSPNPKEVKAFIADFELGKMARFYSQGIGLDNDTVQVAGFGLTGEIYENVVAGNLEDVIVKLAGKSQDIRIAVITSPATNTLAFMNQVHSAASKIPGAEVIEDNEIMPHYMYNKDEAEIISAKRGRIISEAMLDVGLACASPNVNELQIAGAMEWVARNMYVPAYDWRILIGAGKHNNATISDAQDRPLPSRGLINIAGCPYVIMPAPVAPTTRASTWINADKIEEVPKNVVQAYHALQDYFLAGYKAFIDAVNMDGPAPVKLIDQVARDALTRHSMQLPDGKWINMLKTRTYSLAHVMGARECGLPQNGRNSGDITFEAKHNLPEGWGLFGLDAGIGGQGYVSGENEEGGVPYMVIENTIVTNKSKNLAELGLILPIALERRLEFTGTGKRTPAMYHNPLPKPL